MSDTVTVEAQPREQRLKMTMSVRCEGFYMTECEAREFISKLQAGVDYLVMAAVEQALAERAQPRPTFCESLASVIYRSLFRK